MTHDDKTYIAYLKARDLAENLLELYFLNGHGMDSEYRAEYVKDQFDKLKEAMD